MTDGMPYAHLTPDVILEAVESLGFETDGRLLSLNSYENRVWRVGLQDAPAWIVKFYRPGRWSDAAIMQEHDFAAALAEQEIPVVAPWRDAQQQSLFSYASYRFALFPNVGGYEADLESDQHLEQMGRLLARIHRVGELQHLDERGRFDPQAIGEHARAQLLEGDYIHTRWQERYAQVSATLIQLCQQFFDAANPRFIAVHGDCHRGNILWRDQGPVFVDLDDCRLAPAMQDLWMFLDEQPARREQQWQALMEGYEQFRDFPYQEWRLREPLRALRTLRYAAWLATRYTDPAFPIAFPWFGDERYWQEHVLELESMVHRIEQEQQHAMA